MKIKDLRLALSAAPKKTDVRNYLNGVLVKDQIVCGSDGHRLVYIDDMNNFIPAETISGVIIPTDTVKAILKKMGSKNEGKEVIITKNNDRYELSCSNQIEVFEPIDHRYPDFSKWIANARQYIVGDNLSNHQFDWGYVGAAQSAINKYLSATTAYKRFTVINNQGFFNPSVNIFYIIMPVRD